MNLGEIPIDPGQQQQLGHILFRVEVFWLKLVAAHIFCLFEDLDVAKVIM